MFDFSHIQWESSSNDPLCKNFFEEIKVRLISNDHPKLSSVDKLNRAVAHLDRNPQATENLAKSRCGLWLIVKIHHELARHWLAQHLAGPEHVAGENFVKNFNLHVSDANSKQAIELLANFIHSQDEHLISLLPVLENASKAKGYLDRNKDCLERAKNDLNNKLTELNAEVVILLNQYSESYADTCFDLYTLYVDKTIVANSESKLNFDVKTLLTAYRKVFPISSTYVNEKSFEALGYEELEKAVTHYECLASLRINEPADKLLDIQRSYYNVIELLAFRYARLFSENLKPKDKNKAEKYSEELECFYSSLDCKNDADLLAEKQVALDNVKDINKKLSQAENKRVNVIAPSINGEKQKAMEPFFVAGNAAQKRKRDEQQSNSSLSPKSDNSDREASLSTILRTSLPPKKRLKAKLMEQQLRNTMI